jgi:hypothetical protein
VNQGLEPKPYELFDMAEGVDLPSIVLPRVADAYSSHISRDLIFAVRAMDLSAFGSDFTDFFIDFTGSPATSTRSTATSPLPLAGGNRAGSWRQQSRRQRHRFG